MRGMWNRRSGRDLERELRAARPEPKAEFLATLAARVGEATQPRRTSTARIAFAGGLTVVMLVALAAVGGVSYAANSMVAAVQRLEGVLAPESERGVVVVDSLTAGSDQYRPGYGWGDPNHNHTGPPGLRRQRGQVRPRVDRNDRRFVRVGTRVTVDEQAHLTISVVGPRGGELPLSQRRSNIAHGVTGPPTNNVQYALLIPRTILVDLAIPRQLLQRGRTYFIVIRAEDPDGNVSTIRIPFRA